MEKYADFLIVAGSLVFTLVNGLIAHIWVTKWNDMRGVIEDLKGVLREKVDETHCLEWREHHCKKLTRLESRFDKEDREIWEALNRHSHEGVPEASRVIR